jgi:VanZ family protein
LVALLTYWYFGFHPFHFQLPIEIKKNTASFHQSDGIQFNGLGIGYSLGSPKWLKSAIAESKFDIKLEFQTAKLDQKGPARILTISKDLHHRNLTIGQDGADLILRIRTLLSNQNGYPPYRIKDVFIDKKWQRLHISITPDKLNISLNNTVHVANFVPHNPISQWSPNYQLALGNEFTNNRSWQGIIRHVVIRSGKQQIDYAKKENLFFPEYLVLGNASYNLIPFSEDAKTFKPIVDWVINLLGFIPFGFFIMIFTKNRLTVFKAVSICALLSLSIEIGQLFLIRRSSEIEDIILNTIGGFLGILSGLHYRQIK